MICCCLCSLQADGICSKRNILGLLNQASLIDDLAVLSSADMQGRKSGTVGSQLAKDFILGRFTEIGLAYFPQMPFYQHRFSHPTSQSKKSATNLVGWYEGQTYKNRFLVVTAHYDHLGENARHIFYGADDNATGVAVLLALAAKTQQLGLAHSVIFVATDAEEQGLKGARAFVNELPVPRKTVQLNINLDMLGEGGRKKRLFATVTRDIPFLSNLIDSVSKKAPLCLVNDHRKSQRFNSFGKKINWRKASDHAAFAKVNIPYVFLGGGVHKRYHTQEDSFENIDQAFFISAAETAWMLLQAVDANDYQATPNSSNRSFK